MKKLLLPLLLLAATTCHAQEFTLQDEKGKASGPYPVKVGTQVTVGTSLAVITKVRTQKEQVLDDLREIVIPEIEFKQATLRDTVAALQQAVSKADAKKRGLALVYGFSAEQEKAFKGGAISFTAKNMSALDVAHTLAELEGIKFAVQGNLVKFLPKGAPEGELVIRTYTVLPNVIERITGIARDIGSGPGGESLQPHGNVDLAKLFAELGIPWPDGSWIRYLSVIGKLEVCNTEENLNLFELVLEEMKVTPRQIQIEAQFVSYDLTNIAKVVAVNGINTASLTALWTNGFGELLMSPVAVTKAGQEVVVKGVTENIYPTQFTVTGLEPTNEACSFPGGFQTREVGIILQVVPEVSAEGQMINLTLNPQIVEDPVWEDYGSTIRDGQKERRMSMKQPFFHVNSVSTSVSIYNGQRVLAGGGMPSRDRKRVVYLFVSAKLVDPAGAVIKVRDGDALPVPVAK